MNEVLPIRGNGLRSRASHWLTWSIVLVAIMAGLSLAILYLGWHNRSNGAVEVAIGWVLSVISGGILSSLTILMRDESKDSKAFRDFLRRLDADLSINVVSARYNRNPFSDHATKVWGRFIPDSVLAALGRREDLGLGHTEWWAFVQIADRMLAFNQNAVSYFQLTQVHGHSGTHPSDLAEAMIRQAEELYSLYIPVAAHLVGANSARAAYQGTFPEGDEMSALIDVVRLESLGQPDNRGGTISRLSNPKSAVTRAFKDAVGQDG